MIGATVGEDIFVWESEEVAFCSTESYYSNCFEPIRGEFSKASLYFVEGDRMLLPTEFT